VGSSAEVVRVSRKSSNLTQAQLADLASLDQSAISRSENGRAADFGTVEKIVRATGQHLAVVPTRTDMASLASNQISQHLAHDDLDCALRALIQLNDALLAEHGLRRALLVVTQPLSSGSRLWDTAIAALVEWRLNQEKLPAPDWVLDNVYRLESPEFLRIHVADPVPPRSEVPREFLVRNLLVWPETFAST